MPPHRPRNHEPLHRVCRGVLGKDALETVDSGAFHLGEDGWQRFQTRQGRDVGFSRRTAFGRHVRAQGQRGAIQHAEARQTPERRLSRRTIDLQ